MKSVVSILMLGLLLASCSKVQNLTGGQGKTTFDGVQFRARIQKSGDDRQSFVITVPKVSRSLDGAREAGRYEATRYCIKNYGTSDVVWVNSPDADEGQIVVSDDTMTFRGSCAGW